MSDLRAIWSLHEPPQNTNSLARWLTYKTLNRALWFVSHSWLVLLDAQQHPKLIRQYIFQSPGLHTICWLQHLSHNTENFIFVPTDHYIFAISHMFEFYYVWTCFIPNIPFICYLSIPVCSCRLSKATHQHIFSRLVGAQFCIFIHLVGAQFADCMTCLSSHGHLCFGFHRLLLFC